MEIINDANFSELGKFNRIQLKGIGIIYLSFGNKQDIRVDAGAKVLKNIAMETRNDELFISYKSIFPVELLSSPKLNIYITIPELLGITVGGAGKVFCNDIFPVKHLTLYNGGVGSISVNVNAEVIDTHMTGVGKIEVKGRTEIHNVELSGAGKVNAYDLLAKEANVNSKGVGKCVVSVQDKLNINLTGVGKVEYKGNPPVFNCNKTGVGVVERIS